MDMTECFTILRDSYDHCKVLVRDRSLGLFMKIATLRDTVLCIPDQRHHSRRDRAHEAYSLVLSLLPAPRPRTAPPRSLLAPFARCASFAPFTRVIHSPRTTPFALLHIN